MGNAVIINNCEVELEVANEEAYTTSLAIANVFQRRHDNIIAKIDELPQDDFRALNFKETKRKAKFGATVRSERYYKITRDGFVLLAMSFTGERFYKFKVAYINAFNAMADEIKRLKFEAYEGEISSLKTDAEIEAKKHSKKLAYYKGEITKAKNALASYRAKITSRAGFPARINSAELSALNKELTDVKHEAISNMSEVFRLRGEIEDLAGELALANGTIASQKEYIARLSSAVVQASIEQAQAPIAMRHELELLQSDLACLQNKLSAAMSKLKEQSEGNKLYLKDEL